MDQHSPKPLVKAVEHCIYFRLGGFLACIIPTLLKRKKKIFIINSKVGGWKASSCQAMVCGWKLREWVRYIWEHVHNTKIEGEIGNICITPYSKLKVEGVPRYVWEHLHNIIFKIENWGMECCSIFGNIHMHNTILITPNRGAGVHCVWDYLLLFDSRVLWLKVLSFYNAHKKRRPAGPYHRAKNV